MSAQHTPGPWKFMHMGGSSTVLCATRPRHNDTGSPEFGYRDGEGHCIARPFTDDGQRLRRDFVCFSHEDARLIAAAPDLLEACERMMPRNLCTSNPNVPDDTIIPLDVTMREMRAIAAAIAKARGEKA